MVGPGKKTTKNFTYPVLTGTCDFKITQWDSGPFYLTMNISNAILSISKNDIWLGTHIMTQPRKTDCHSRIILYLFPNSSYYIELFYIYFQIHPTEY